MKLPSLSMNRSVRPILLPTDGRCDLSDLFDWSISGCRPARHIESIFGRVPYRSVDRLERSSPGRLKNRRTQSGIRPALQTILRCQDSETYVPTYPTARSVSVALCPRDFRDSRE